MFNAYGILWYDIFTSALSYIFFFPTPTVKLEDMNNVEIHTINLSGTFSTSRSYRLPTVISARALTIMQSTCIVHESQKRKSITRDKIVYLNWPAIRLKIISLVKCSIRHVLSLILSIWSVYMADLKKIEKKKHILPWLSSYFQSILMKIFSAKHVNIQCTRINYHPLSLSKKFWEQL